MSETGGVKRTLSSPWIFGHCPSQDSGNQKGEIVSQGGRQ